MNNLADLDAAIDASANVSLPRDVVAQRTLKSGIGCTGIGLHSGTKIHLTLKPAPVNTGIVFRRIDQDPVVEIPARWDHVVDGRLCTVIGAAGPDGPVTIATIEHLMSALAGAGIDNLYIDIDGGEVPAMDGSAAPFLFLIDCAGVREQAAPRMVVEVIKPVTVNTGKAEASLSPADEFSLDFELDYENKVIGRQVRRAFMDEFASGIAKARTFCLKAEVDMMRQNGLALGGSLENAVVVEDAGVMNEEGLRYEDEFVRHKILDAIGDLYTSGGQILGHFSGVRSGHAVNNLLLRELFSDSANYRLVPQRIAKRKSPVTKIAATA